MTSPLAGPSPPSHHRRHWLLGVTCLLLACGGAQPIYIGLAGPLSDPVGVPMQRAARLAVEQINASGGIGGRPLVLIEMDDRGSPDSAIAVASALRASRAVAVIGHLQSTATIATAPIYGSGTQPLPIISPSSSSPEVSWLGDHVFRVCPSDDDLGTALADWAWQSLAATRVGVLYLNNDYGRGVRRTFERRFRTRGGEIAGSFPYLDAGREAGLYLDRLTREGRFEALLLAGYPEDVAVVLAAARSRGITVPVLGGDALEGFESQGALAEGVYISVAWFPDDRTAAAAEFLDSYAASVPDAPVPNQPGAATWDAVHLLAGVLRSTTPDRAAVQRALAGVGSRTAQYQGVTGPIGFTPEGDLAQSRIAITVVRDGRPVRAESP